MRRNSRIDRLAIVVSWPTNKSEFNQLKGVINAKVQLRRSKLAKR